VERAYISGLIPFFDFGIDLGGKGIHTGTLGKVGDDKIIQ
jgi:hypothetical protein